MRKDVKFVVAAACLLLIGLLAYVLFFPGTKKAHDVASATGEDATTSTGSTPTITPDAAPITVSVGGPTTQPSIVVVPATQPSGIAVVPSTDSNIATATAGGATDWDKTLNSGSLASGPAHNASQGSGLTTLMGSTAGSDLAAGPSTRPSSVATVGQKTHKVLFGETLSSIAAEYYGNSANYQKIASANPSINANRLKPGTVLIIPELKTSSLADATPASGTSLVAGNLYTVKPGDSLQRIASRTLGSTDKWEKIYDLNKSAIGSDPHRLKAGMVLKLPEGANTTSAAVH